MKPNARVAIVDLGMGNLFSVSQACAHAGLDAMTTASASDVSCAAGIVLPGVGAMPDAMATLRETGLADAVRQAVDDGRPVMAICLGLQLLMTEGTEFERHAGLGVFKGRVVRFDSVTTTGERLKVPHIGWEPVRRCGVAREWDQSLLGGLPSGEPMYFVHSYFVVPERDDEVIAKSAYGGREFCAAMASGNVFACQFHPERSGHAGLVVYRRFAERIQSRNQ